MSPAAARSYNRSGAAAAPREFGSHRPTDWRALPLSSLQHDLDDAAGVAHAVSLLRLPGAEEPQLADRHNGDFAQPVQVAGTDAVDVDLQLAGARIHDADDAARAQPVGPILHDQRQ